MRARILAGVAAASLILLAGCSAPPEPTPTPTHIVVAADVSCGQVSDVLTLLTNVFVARQEERLSSQEVTGAINLAHSMMSYVQSEPDTDIGVAVQKLKAVPFSGLPYPNAGGDEDEVWNTAMGEVGDACRAAGFELAISAWTGG